VSPPTNEITLRRASDGSIVVGADIVAPAGVAAMPVRGGTLLVDPMNPSERFQLRIPGGGDEDIEAVSALCGDRVAAAIATLGREERSVRFTPTEALLKLTHLAMLNWLDETTPLPLDPRLLTVEGLALEAELVDLVVADKGVEDRLIEWLPTLVQWGRASQVPSLFLAQVPPFVVMVRRALSQGRATAESGRYAAQLREQGLRLLEIDVLAQSLGAIEVESSAGTHPGLGNGARSELSQLRPSRSATKVRRAPYLEGVACVDWGRVPRGVVGRGEDCTTWRICSLPAPLVSIVAAVAPADPSCAVLDTVDMGERHRREPPPLRARVFQSGWATPLAVVDLALRSETAAWLGAAPLRPQVTQRLADLAPHQLVVDVVPPGLHPAPSVGVDGSVAAATRWAARGLSAVRVAAAYPSGQWAELRAGAVSAFEVAGQMFRGSSSGRHQAAAEQCEQAARCVSRGLADGSRAVRSARSGLAGGKDGSTAIDLGPRASVAEAWYAASVSTETASGIG